MTGQIPPAITTASLLEQMTDRGLFEKLASAVLRRTDPRLKGIMETGTNAQGETVKSPCDCFCLVAGSNPALFVLVHHTTTDRKSLRAKWLSEQTGAGFAGDMSKAVACTFDIGQQFPTAQFLLVLTTNQCVKKDLATDVYAAGSRDGIDVDIYDQSRLADFLDNEPDGQWLRQKYLNVTAERLSLPLFMSICRQNVVQYEKFLNTRVETLVGRNSEERTLQATVTGSTRFVLLVGTSGSGKSVLAYRLLAKLLEDGQPALWLDADAIPDALTLPAVLDAQLRRYHPELSSSAGADALRMTAEGKPLILVVDDISRSREPDKLLRRLLAIDSSTAEGNRSNLAASEPAVLVFPVWTDVWARSGQDIGKRADIAVVRVGRMEVEGASAVQTVAGAVGVNITVEQARKLASKMAFEPIQLGLFGRLLIENPHANLEALADNTLESYTKMTLDRLSRVTPRFYLTAEYEDTVARLGSRMLQQRNLRPTWSDVEQWLTPSSPDTERMRDIVRDGELCRVSDKRELLFRHDRVLETVIVAGAKLLLSQAATEADALYDPYYTDILGRVLVGPDTETGTITAVGERNPAALFGALRRLPDPPTAWQRKLVTQAISWAKSYAREPGTIPAVIDSACWSLMETDAPFVFEVSEAFPRYWPIQLARLSNGSAVDGAAYCGGGGFEFGVGATNHLRDSAIAHALVHHLDSVVAGLANLLHDANQPDFMKEGGLSLAGFVADPRLEDCVESCWESARSKIDLLPAAIWAVARCGGPSTGRLLTSILQTWRGMSDQRDQYGGSPRRDLSHVLRFALRHGISERAIRCLAHEARVGDESWQSMLCFLIGHVDHPLALEVLVRYLADQRRGGQDGFWMSIYYDRWDPNQPGGRSMSHASLDHLWELANATKEDRFVHDAALGIWLNAVREDRLGQVRNVPPDSTYYGTSLQRRTEFGDMDVVPPLLRTIESSPWLLWKANRVWCPSLRQAVDSLLKSLAPAVCTRSPSDVDEISHGVSRLLMRIPRADAEQLISSNWPDVSHLHYLVLAALYIGTSKCLELADQAIRQAPPGSKPLELVTHIFGIGTIPDQDFLEPRHFEALRPYLELIDKPHLGWIAEGCQRLGLASWSREHILPLLDGERRERHFPTDEQLIEWLDRLLKDLRAHGVYGVEIWLRGFEERHDPTDRALVVLDKWLSANRTADALEIVSAALRRIGKRSTLSLLDKYEVTGPTDVVNRIKENARYAVRTRSLD